MSWMGQAVPRQCPECRAAVDPVARFCERCGAEVAPAAAWSPPAGAHPVVPAPPAAGPEGGGAAETYLGYRLVYSDLGTDFNPLSNATYQRTLLYQFLATTGLWLLVTTVLALLQVVFQYVSGGSANSALGLSVLTVVFSVGLACVFWFRPLSVQLSEWMITVDGAGPSAPAALEHMYLIVHNRQTPLHTLRVVRLRAARQQQRDYLRLDDGHFSGFVSSFSFGTDLFIGWTFWLTLSPAQWLWLSFSRLFRAASDNIYGSLVNDHPKAMREVMHAAVRQGVDMATGRTKPLGQGGHDHALPFTTVEA